jgi:hypothetical protein
MNVGALTLFCLRPTACIHWDQRAVGPGRMNVGGPHILFALKANIVDSDWAEHAAPRAA